MPIYTLKDTKTQDEWDVQMSYDDLQIVLDENPEFIHVLKPLKISAVAWSSRTLGITVYFCNIAVCQI